MPAPILVIACGALAREIDALRRRWGWQHLHMKCIDAKLHNRPAEIPERLRQMIRRHRSAYDDILVAYADCGTAGGIDRVLEEEGAERLEGAHCYEFFAGSVRFAELSTAEPGTFYLTDFLARHFERFVVKPLGLDRHPELRNAYFGNYRKLVYLSQTHDARLVESAARAAARLKLEFEHVHCGYGGLETGLAARFSPSSAAATPHRPGSGERISAGPHAPAISASRRPHRSAARFSSSGDPMPRAISASRRPHRCAAEERFAASYRKPNHGQEDHRFLA